MQSWDERRDYIIAGDRDQAIAFAVEHWLHSLERAVQQRGRFAVALSGGSTPKAIYERLGKEKIDGTKIWLFWSDERNVPPDHPDSNYRMAMESGLNQLQIPKSQIFRMKGEGEIEKNASDYEEVLRHHLGKNLFDLVMLGVGEDGHTASLFPNSPGLEESKRLVIATEKRITLTFRSINESFHSVVYAIGSSKQRIVPKILNAPILSPFPASQIGTTYHKALWVLDNDAGRGLK